MLKTKSPQASFYGSYLYDRIKNVTFQQIVTFRVLLVPSHTPDLPG